QGDEAVERLLPRLEDDAHAALGNLPDQLIIAEAVPFFGRQGRTRTICIRFGHRQTGCCISRHRLINGLNGSARREVGTHFRTGMSKPLAIVMTFRRLHRFLGPHRTLSDIGSSPELSSSPPAKVYVPGTRARLAPRP